MTFRNLALAAVAVIIVGCATTPSEEKIRARAERIHERIITIDTHVDIPGNFATPERDPGVRGNAKVDLPKMREGGLNAVFFAAFVGQSPRTPENLARAQETALQKMHAIRRMTYEMHQDQIELAYTAADVERIHKSGKLVAVMSIENGHALGADLSKLPEYYELGVRCSGLTHGGHNDLADSTSPRAGEPAEEHGGLSKLGRQYVRDMNRLGIIIDVSHASKKAARQTLQLSRGPIIASHSGAKALTDSSRNMDDEELLALKANGGVIHIVALRSFIQPRAWAEAMSELREHFGISGTARVSGLSTEDREAYDKALQIIEERLPPVNIKDFIDHIDYVVNLIGIDHVGIGSDFDGGGGVPGFNDASESLNVTIELVRRGYTEDQIRKIWGGNLLRVWREVERVSRETVSLEEEEFL